MHPWCEHKGLLAKKNTQKKCNYQPTNHLTVVYDGTALMYANVKFLGCR